MAESGRFVGVVGLCAAVLLAGVAGCGGASTTDGGAAKDDKAKGASKVAKPEPKPSPSPPEQPDPTPDAKLPATPATLAEAEAAAKEIYADHRVTFYCGCSYTGDLRTIRQSCGYRTRADESLAHEIRWTHVVPARQFGAHRPCWTTEACKRDDGTSFGGIECCRQSDPVFSRMETDLHNLVPEIAEVEKDRSDYPFGAIKGEARMYGACDIEVDGQAGVVEPPDKVRGDIARIYMYMRGTYGDELRVPEDQWALLQQWSTEDPLDAWEQTRAERIVAGRTSPPAKPEGGAPSPGPDAAPAKPEAKAPAESPAPAPTKPGPETPTGKGA